MKRVYLCAAIFAAILSLSVYTYIWTGRTLAKVEDGVREVRDIYAASGGVSPRSRETPCLEVDAAVSAASDSVIKLWKKVLSRQFLMSDKEGISEITQQL